MAQIENLEIVIASNASDAAQKINSLASSLSGLKGSSASAAGGLKAVEDELGNVNGSVRKGASEAGNLGNKFTELGKRVQAAMGSTKGFGGTLKGLAGVLKGAAGGVLGFVGNIARIAKYRFIRAMIKDLVQSFKDLYGYSDKFGTGFADAMDKITTSTTYFRNSLAAMVAPLVEMLAPALDFIIDKVVEVLNWFNQLFAALSGSSTYTAARKVERAWSSTFNNTTNSARQAQKELKRTILGFDEINKLNDTTNSGSSGGSGSSPYTNGYELMFEQLPIDSGFLGFSNAIETALSNSVARIEMIVGGASLGLGAILAFSGVNIPLGIALMAAGAAVLTTIIALNWNDLSDSTLGIISTIEAAVGAALLALGAILAFSSVNIPLGIALMAAGAVTLASAVDLNWENMSNDVSSVVALIEGIVGGALLTIGAILAFSSVNIPLGIALMAAGAVSLAASVSMNWEWLQTKISENLGAILLIGTLMTVIGAILLFSMASPGIGLALLIAGLATTVTAVVMNWDSIVETIKGVCNTIKEAVSTWWNNTVEWFKNIGELIWTTIRDGVVGAVEGIAEWVETTFNNIKQAVSDWWDGVVEWFSNLGSTIWETIRDGIGGAVKGIGSWIKEHVFKPFQDMWNWLFGKPAEDEEEYGLQAKLSYSIDDSAVGQSKDVNGLLGEDEPSYSELRQMGLDFGQAIRDGIKDKMSGVASEIFNKIKEEWTHGERSLSMSVIASVKRGDEWDNDAFMIATFWKTRELTNARHALVVGVEKSDYNWDNVAWMAAQMPSGTAVHYLKVGVEQSNNWDKVALLVADIPSGAAIHYLKVGVEKLDNWDNVALLVADIPSGTAIHYLKVGVEQFDTWDKVALLVADIPSGTAIHYLKVGIERSANWDNVALDVANIPAGTAVHYLVSGIRKSIYWDNVALTAAQMPSGTTVHYLVSGVKKSVYWDNVALSAADMKSGTTVHYLISGVKRSAYWDNVAKMVADVPSGTAVHYLISGVKKSAYWDNVALSAADMKSGTSVHYLISGVKRSAYWDNVAKAAADMKSGTAVHYLVSGVKRSAYWDNVAWLAAQMVSGTAVHYLVSGVKRSAYWDTAAWSAANMGGSTVARFINVAVTKAKTWVDDAWKAAQMLGGQVLKTVVAAVRKSEVTWDADAWQVVQTQNKTTTITVNVKMQKDGWTTVEQYMKDSFGSGAGSGNTVEFQVPLTLGTITKSIWDAWWNNTKKSWASAAHTVEVAVDAVKDWTGSLVDYLGISDEDIAVYVDALSQWRITGMSFLSYLGIGGNVNKNVGVDATKKWGTKSFLEYLGIDNLQTNVKVSAQVAERGNTITVSPGGSNRWVLQTQKMGGVYSNGIWSDIPQYASGTLNAGSIFAAGEAGPELVGHIGGRTEVLNKSQLAATMYSAVQAAMAPASANFAAAATQMYRATEGAGGEDMETLMEMVRQTNDATMRQNELLREQNDYLRQLNDKDFTAEITTSGISRAQARANRRAGTTVIPVGT